MDREIKEIFRQNSTSYYYSSLFFPKDIREDVFKLYAYVRTADDYVDEKPQQPEKLEEMKTKTLENWENQDSGDKIVDIFLEVANKYDFKKQWAAAFINSMQMDTEKNEYQQMDESLEYIYGSAEVIGLMMTQMLGLDEDAKEASKMLGRAMQYCNFIRDIKEDPQLGRRYLPRDEMEQYGLETLEEDEVDSEKFREFIKSQIKHYRKWQKKGEKGFKHIPYRVRVPVILSSRLYKYTADKIEEDPEVVYREKVRPSKPRIAYELLVSLLGRK